MSLLLSDIYFYNVYKKLYGYLFLLTPPPLSHPTLPHKRWTWEMMRCCLVVLFTKCYILAMFERVCKVCDWPNIYHFSQQNKKTPQLETQNSQYSSQNFPEQSVLFEKCARPLIFRMGLYIIY